MKRGHPFGDENVEAEPPPDPPIASNASRAG